MVFKSETMNINFKDSVAFLTFKELEKYSFIKHGYSTRIGGVSRNEFKSLNLSFSVGDTSENVSENYDIFCTCLGIQKNKLALTSQVHKDTIMKVSKKDLNRNDFTQFEETDGLVTDETGIVLTTFHADCIAIYMIDVSKKVVGLAHAGWRGTVQNIAGKLARKFVSEYNSSLSDIVCAIGPGIGSCCFEVSESLLEHFSDLNIQNTFIRSSKNDNKVYIDLLEVNRCLLLKEGLKNENIFKSDVCTMCNHDLLFSHRFTEGKRGTNCAFIFID